VSLPKPDLLILSRVCPSKRRAGRITGKRSVCVESGKNCIEKYVEEKNRGNKIHLILLDYRLGDMLGDAVARKIKEYNGVKIILISAYDLDNALVKELEESKSIVQFIEKPIEPANLIEIVARTIS
jgi:CheY-like chemotaxis protein